MRRDRIDSFLYPWPDSPLWLNCAYIVALVAGVVVAVVMVVEAVFANPLCLPPGVPPIETLAAISGEVYQIEGQRETEHFLVVATLYQSMADGAHYYKIYRMLGAAALVDDDPLAQEPRNWWVDSGLITDEDPPRAQASPKSTCLFHRRGEST